MPAQRDEPSAPPQAEIDAHFGIVPAGGRIGLLQNALSFRAKREIRSYFTLFHVKSTDFSVASSLEMTGSCILQQAHGPSLR